MKSKKNVRAVQARPLTATSGGRRRGALSAATALIVAFGSALTAAPAIAAPAAQAAAVETSAAGAGLIGAASGIRPLSFATGGAGQYQGAIDWFEWGTQGANIPAAGTTRSNTRQIAGDTLVTTCTLGAPSSGGLRVYIPGTWREDGLDDLYNEGGTGSNNQMTIGLTNRNDGDTVGFHFSCDVSLNGEAVPLAGLVMADAEASGRGSEYVQATLPAGAEWRMIDRYRPAGCTSDAAIVRTGQTLRLDGASGPSCSTYPTGVAFMEGASSADVQIKGGGKSAVALGVMLFTDFGDAPDDAPANYGDAGALYSPGFTGAAVPQGDSTLFGEDLSVADQPELRLGATVTSEPGSQPSEDASADRGDDGVRFDTDESVTGRTETVRVEASAPGYVNAWIDFNRNGTFDAGERIAADVPVVAGENTITYAVPTGAAFAAGISYARFRISEGPGQAASPTGIATNGEVEDYLRVLSDVLDRDVVVAKSSSLTADSRPGDTVTYAVTVTNTGIDPYTAEDPAVIFDDLSGVVDDATYNGDAVASSTAGSPVADPAFIAPSHLSWAGPLAPGESVEITYSVTLTGAGDGVVRNVAWQPATPPADDEVPPTPSCDVDGDSGTDAETGEACAANAQELPRLSVMKTSDASGLLETGQVAYAVTLTNEGPGSYTETAPAVVTDDLSGVLDDAVFGRILAPASGAAFDAAAKELAWSGPLDAGESVTIAYVVDYDARSGDHLLINVACVPADQVLPGAENCASTVDEISSVVASKSSDPQSGSTIEQGKQVTYTLTFRNDTTNPSAVAAPIDYTDHMAGVLDDATLTTPPSSSDAAVAAAVVGDTIRITGAVAPGETVTVTYTVTVKAYDQQGDHRLGNILAVTGEPPVCAADSPLCTDHDLLDPTPLATTGGDVAWAALFTALALVLGGGLLLTVRRRRTTDEVPTHDTAA